MTLAQRAGIERAKARRAAMTPDHRAEAKRKHAEAVKAGLARTPEERRLYSNALKNAWNRRPDNNERRKKLRKVHARKYYLRQIKKPGVRERNAERKKEWHAKHKNRCLQQQKERLARLKVDNPKAYARHKALRQAAARRRWAEKRLRANAGDPEALAFFEKKNAESQRKYERIKADPVRFAAWRATVNEYVKRKHAEIAADPKLYAKYRERMNAAARRYHDKLRARDPRHVDSVLAEIGKLVPHGMPLEVRGDLINDVYAALLSGEITRAELPKALKRYTTRAWKLLGETWNQQSLDAPIPGTDGLTVADTIAADHMHF